MSPHIPTKIMRPYRSLPFFNQVPARERELLVRMGTELIVPAGTVVASSGNGGRQCTILLSGTFTWFEPDLAGGFEPTRHLSAGDFLDEAALCRACAGEHGPGAFLVHASTDSRVFVYHRSEFTAVLRDAPRTRSLAALCTGIHLSAWEPTSVRPLVGLRGSNIGNSMCRAG
ncbi:MAG TPA: cyclic nucleotide-binding domain-containing protein [Acidimicrobiales bacterium]|nr:cyclic nucleotide-binding domain-containing protein [Acidimicrobiales bacterium]